ncbi:PaaX family transcriptional regulator C-terminal domain-containing protein [Tateyamaria omphalii]|uniref:PaaX family transcriptional regulator C-terminal domain-containing protein n=1 Tax=Tateyamaria omphalii TaxID=299262 RepID=UPI0016734767|nr:PaaX family transcriptional regulator C-terminal domain-containing protein [Tateyamaria omphalii]
MERLDVKELATRLNNGQPPRVWSLLVTVFGELAQDETAQLSGETLRQFMEIVGIKPEATRVALHRLRKDGWLSSQKDGRKSNYFLTKKGRDESIKASPRIYSETALADKAWLVMQNVGEPVGAQKEPGVWITGHLRITGVQPDEQDALVIEMGQSNDLPDWMRARLCDASLLEQSQALANTLRDLDYWLADEPKLDEFHREVLRVLVVHSWRRIALKVPSLPDNLFLKPWSGPDCRRLVAQIRKRLS